MRETWLVSEREEVWFCTEEFASKEEAAREGPEVLGLEPGERFFVGRRDTAHEEEHAQGSECEECEEDWVFRVVDIEELAATEPEEAP